MLSVQIKGSLGSITLQSRWKVNVLAALVPRTEILPCLSAIALEIALLNAPFISCCFQVRRSGLIVRRIICKPSIDQAEEEVPFHDSARATFSTLNELRLV